MKKLKLVCIAILLIFQMPQLNAQAVFKDWGEKPVPHAVKDTKASAVILNDQRIHEYKKDEKGELQVYIFNRRLIKLNDEKGVEMYNKIYIYIPYGAVVTDTKARTIQPNGKVVDLPADKIFEVEEEGKRYKKFALEGVEKGSEVEYFIEYKKELTTFGIEMFQSNSTAYETASFTLIVPEHLIFSVKGYNGFTVGKEEIADKKRTTTATGSNIEAIDDDKYAVTAPFSANVQYKLSYNVDKDKSVRMYTWNELAKNVYNNYYTLESKEQKAIDEFYKKMKLDEKLSEESKIVFIEDYIKNNINADENAIGEDADLLDKIVKTKVAGNYGFNKLMLNVYEKAGIKHQIVFPSKRDDLPIDEEFENFRLIDDMLIYFPGTGNFLEPMNATYRYPFVQAYYAGTKGLFLKGTALGDFKTAVPGFDSIPMHSFEKNANNLYVDIEFDQNVDSVILHSKQSLMGYSAVSYRPAFSFLPKDKQDEFKREVIKSISNTESIRNIKVENEAMTDGSKDLPLNFIADLTTHDLTEVAGNKILFKLGQVIGPQEQLYQEKKRQLPIIMPYPHVLDREIRFTIPKGYKIKNPDDVNFNVTDKSGNNPATMGFVAAYTMKGDVMEIKIHEYYTQTDYPLNWFEPFRKVINAAADFNKVVLVLEKL